MADDIQISSRSTPRPYPLAAESASPAPDTKYKGEPMSEWCRAVVEMIELSRSGDEDAEAALLAFQTAHRHAFPCLSDKAFR